MAIAGLLVHTLKENLEDVERQIRSMPGMTTYGIHQDQYVVVVVEAPSDQMETQVDRINNLEGVLTIYTTYVTVEDELSGTDDR
ncbi:MAG: chaperone NapD [Desulfobacteraceae bacterium]|nr:chaperone NapD [Desulfobacteraceae bacterium]